LNLDRCRSRWTSRYMSWYSQYTLTVICICRWWTLLLGLCSSILYTAVVCIVGLFNTPAVAVWLESSCGVALSVWKSAVILWLRSFIYNFCGHIRIWCYSLYLQPICSFPDYFKFGCYSLDCELCN
jgi:hypothetical protein